MLTLVPTATISALDVPGRLLSSFLFACVFACGAVAQPRADCLPQALDSVAVRSNGDVFVGARREAGNAEIGVILVSKDGGKTWVETLAEVGVEFDEIQFISETKGIAAGIGRLKSIYYETRDGGASWEKMPVSTNDIALAIEVYNETDIWLVGALGSIAVSRDGGEKWITEKKQGVRGIYDVELTREDELFVGGEKGLLWRVTSGGQKWDDLWPALKRTLPSNDGSDVVALRFSGQRNGSAIVTTSKRVKGSDDYVYSDMDTYLAETKDGGVTWSARRVLRNVGAVSAHFVTGNSVVLVPWTYWQTENIFRSNDGGYSWARIDTSRVLGTPFQFSFVNDRFGWMLADAGELFETLYKTQDGGNTWQQIETCKGNNTTAESAGWKN